MQVRLFGELEAEHAGVPVPVRGAKQRALLALLALRPGQPVIGQLRRTFGATAILTTEAGYALAAGPDEVDVVRFEHLVAQGRQLAEAGQAADASVTLGQALGLRRGDPLADFTYTSLFDAERTRLDELVLVAIETRAEADLVLGRHSELAAGLEAWCREHPLRERLWELRILALYRAGRQAEALRAYTEVRDRLVGELGIDPGPDLQELQARILAQDPSLSLADVTASPAPTPAAAPPQAPGNLRERLSSFVGRDAELEQLRQAVRSSRLVTLTGPGGAGKTRLRALPLATVAERLDDRFRLLTGGARTALPRQQTLRAVVDWSYDLLFSDERRLFIRLAVFTGGCAWMRPRRSAPTSSCQRARSWMR